MSFSKKQKKLLKKQMRKTEYKAYMRSFRNTQSPKPTSVHKSVKDYDRKFYKTIKSDE